MRPPGIGRCATRSAGASSSSTSDEKALFRRLSVFVGGCTLEAVEEVCGGDLDGLGSLVDKSLVRADGERFAMLETIHEYAGELLDASTEAEDIRRAHAAHYLRFVQAVAAGTGMCRGRNTTISALLFAPRSTRQTRQRRCSSAAFSGASGSSAAT